MLPEEQVAQIKSQIIQQIESTFPEDKKNMAIQQIEAMNNEQLEEFLKQNNLMRGEGEQPQGKCIFCSIASGETQSYKIEENENAVAVLELNPISHGHSLIIPKEHLASEKEIPEEVLNFAKEIASKIKTKLSPKEISISSTNLFGHQIINILPIYTDENQNSPRKKAQPEELEQLQQKLTEQETAKIEEEPEEKEEITEENTWLPNRIP